MMNKSLLLTTLAAALAFSAPVSADHHKAGAMEGGKPGAAQMQPEKGAAYGADADSYEYGFKKMDRDQDGYLSREEARQHYRLHENWDKVDADRDGKLNESEFSAFEDEEPADTSER